MGKLFKNLKPYWKSVLVIVVLLVVQAFCDLSLPQYTSDIIDTGIQNSGVEHILPEKNHGGRIPERPAFHDSRRTENMAGCLQR